MNIFSSKKVLSLCAAVFSILIYIGTLSNGFIFDDHAQILNNPWIKDISYIKDAFFSSRWDFYDSNLSTYRPMIHVVYTMAYKLFGFEAWGWHLINVLIHSGNAVLVFLIASEAMPGEGEKRPLLLPFLSSVLFAAHPVNTEAVAWAACIPELGYTFFTLLALYTYILSKNGFGPTYFISIFSFSAAIFFKEPAVVLFPVIAAWDYFKGDLRLRSWKRYAPYLPSVILFLILRSKAISGTKMFFLYDPVLQALSALPVIKFYIHKLLFPLKLSAFNIGPIEPLTKGSIIFSLMVIAAFVAGILYLFKKAPRPVAFFLSIMIMPVIPTFYFLVLNPDAYIFTFSERYLYLSSAGFALLFSFFTGLVLSGLNDKKACAAVLLAAFSVAGLYAIRTKARVPAWKDDLTLWTRTLEEEPANHFAYFMLGQIHLRNNEKEKAAQEFKESIRIRPGFAPSHHSLGLIYYSYGKNDEALKEFKEVLKTDKANKDAYYNIALIYMDGGRWDEAIYALEQSVANSRGREALKALNALAVSYGRIGRLESARSHLEKARAIDRSDKETVENLKFLEKLPAE